MKRNKMGRPVGLPKTGGRKKGTPNKVTTDLRGAVIDFLDTNWDDIQKSFDELDALNKLAFIERLLRYSLPIPRQLPEHVMVEQPLFGDDDEDGIIIENNK